MSIKQPGDYHPQFAAAFNAGDLEGMLALYEPTASMTIPPGVSISGQAAMREAIRGFLDMKPAFQITTCYQLEAGDLVLTGGDWSLAATGPDGSPVNMTGRSAEVLRRQADGTWLCVLDNAVANA